MKTKAREIRIAEAERRGKEGRRTRRRRKIKKWKDDGC